jgi:hypothetical protein
VAEVLSCWSLTARLHLPGKYSRNLSSGKQVDSPGNNYSFQAVSKDEMHSISTTAVKLAAAGQSGFCAAPRAQTTRQGGLVRDEIRACVHSPADVPIEARSFGDNAIRFVVNRGQLPVGPLAIPPFYPHRSNHPAADAILDPGAVRASGGPGGVGVPGAG